jgi:oligopeptide/dipeptide ABC transporter ATP-binding protein
MSLIEVRDLTIQYRPPRPAIVPWQRGAQVVCAVDQVSFQLDRGECLGLVGESGCGKTSIGRCIAGLTPATSGHVLFAGADITHARDRMTRRRIQMVFQDPYASLNPRLTVRKMLGEILTVHRLVPRPSVDDRCRELLELVGLGKRVLNAYPRELSGGQRQRVSIARAVALEPEVILADEPVSALDVSVQATVLKLLDELRQALGIAVLLISHNLAVVRHFCDRVSVMYLGRIVELAEVEELFARSQHPYTRGLLAAVPQLEASRRRARPAVAGDPPSPIDPPAGCHFHPRCALATPVCTSDVPSLRGRPGNGDHRSACHYAWSERMDEL